MPVPHPRPDLGHPHVHQLGLRHLQSGNPHRLHDLLHPHLNVVLQLLGQIQEEPTVPNPLRPVPHRPVHPQPVRGHLQRVLLALLRRHRLRDPRPSLRLLPAPLPLRLLQHHSHRQRERPHPIPNSERPLQERTADGLGE